MGREGWEENSGQRSKVFCSVGTNSLCREAFVISPEQGLLICHPSSLRCVGLASLPRGPQGFTALEGEGLLHSVQTPFF